MPNASLLSYKIYLSCYNASDQNLVLNSCSPVDYFHHPLQCYICIKFINVINNDSSMKQQEQFETKMVMHLSIFKILWWNISHLLFLFCANDVLMMQPFVADGWGPWYLEIIKSLQTFNTINCKLYEASMRILMFKIDGLLTYHFCWLGIIIWIHTTEGEFILVDQLVLLMI